MSGKVLTKQLNGIISIENGGTNNITFSNDEILIYGTNSIVSSGTKVSDLELTFEQPLSNTGGTVSLSYSNEFYINSNQLTIATNSISNTQIATHSSTKITITNKSQLNSSIVYVDQANNFSQNMQKFRSQFLSIANSTDTFYYRIVSGTISQNIDLNLPGLTQSDTLTTNNFTQTLTNKTINLTNNTLNDNSIQLGDLIKSNGTKFVRFPRGTANQILTSTGTDIQWISKQSYATNVSGNLTTTSTTDVLLPGSQQTNVNGGDYLVFFGGTVNQSNNNQFVYFSVYINGTRVSGSEQFYRKSATNDQKPISIAGLFITAPANATVEIRWRVNGNTGTITNSYFSLLKL